MLEMTGISNFGGSEDVRARGRTPRALVPDVCERDPAGGLSMEVTSQDALSPAPPSASFTVAGAEGGWRRIRFLCTGLLKLTAASAETRGFVRAAVTRCPLCAARRDSLLALRPATPHPSVLPHRCSLVCYFCANLLQRVPLFTSITCIEPQNSRQESPVGVGHRKSMQNPVQ